MLFLTSIPQTTNRVLHISVTASCVHMAKHPVTFVFTLSTHSALTVRYAYQLFYLYEYFPWLALLKWLLRVLKRLCAIRKVRCFSYSGLWERASACHWSSIWNVCFHCTQTEVSVPKIIEAYYSIISDKELHMLLKTRKVTSLFKSRWLLVALECVRFHSELLTYLLHGAGSFLRS